MEGLAEEKCDEKPECKERKADDSTEHKIMGASSDEPHCFLEGSKRHIKDRTDLF